MSLSLRFAMAAGLAAAAFAAPGAHAADTHANQLRVMTFNVRLASGDDGINAWPHRRDLMVKTIREEHPDVMGTQELFDVQGNYVVDHLKNYVWFGIGRNGYNEDHDDNEHMGVFYNTKRLKLLKSGNFWLSDTPDVPGSSTWGQPFPRMVTWAEFQMKSSGKRFYYYNTHFPYREQAEAIREKCAEEIAQRMAKLPQSLPFVLTGDFNTTPGSHAHAVLTQHLHDAWDSAPKKSGPAHTFHGFTGKATKRIDWILYRGLTAKDVRTVTTHQGKVYPSDHFPVVADFSWKK
ncbi:endonuclease/exonuclease/phosphatase family protein [Oleiagrimonas sp. C23AA]|uniref:endonuclease/exonuclease/phosphatase family protein n=1 Tax=Oleiagrimonas sp. C23AA TaxID=2719047 RepID=UPI00141EA2BD|nr:endonuclease/exonuclease/phosphatase family protein [Oleiagrimonas sp. C23AA]NII09722.1 endonuclease/exonuclease/phosphatase family protein [Oleiagrimonas sp. C23AA]